MVTPVKHAQPDIPAAAGRMLVRLGLAVLMIALPVASIASRRLVFSLMPIGGALIIIGGTMTPHRRMMDELRRALRSPAGLSLLALAFWAGLSLVWTPFPGPAAERFAKGVGTVALALVVILFLPPRTRTSDINLMPLGAGVAAIAAVALALSAPALLPRMSDTDASTLERAAVGLVLLVWPALAALAARERWTMAGALVVAVAVAAIAVWTPAALVGIVVAALVFSFAIGRAPRAGQVVGALFAAIIILAPLFPFLGLKLGGVIGGVPLALTKSLLATTETMRADMPHLVTGFGFDTYTRALASGYLPVNALGGLLSEIWFELGALGAVLAAACAYFGFAAAGRTAPVIAPFLLAALTCMLVIALSGLGVFQLWWLTLLSVMAIGFGCVLKGQTRDVRPGVQSVRSAPAPAV